MTNYTLTVHYPCGCSVDGPENMPRYCPKHGHPPLITMDAEPGVTLPEDTDDGTEAKG